MKKNNCACLVHVQNLLVTSEHTKMSRARAFEFERSFFCAGSCFPEKAKDSRRVKCTFFFKATAHNASHKQTARSSKSQVSPGLQRCVLERWLVISDLSDEVKHTQMNVDECIHSAKETSQTINGELDIIKPAKMWFTLRKNHIREN